MPKRVPYVPNRWRPYMDGSVWQFTHGEFSSMPRFIPDFDRATAEPRGFCQITWTIGLSVYVVFYNRDTNPEGNNPALYEEPIA